MSLDPCHPGVGHIGLVRGRERVGCLPQQPAAPTSQRVHQGDFFACYERCDSTASFQADRPVTGVAQGWVANAPCLYLVKLQDQPL